MPEYQLKFTAEGTEEETREKTLNELFEFMSGMEGLNMIVVTLDEEQSENWDKEGAFDYQDHYGRQIVQQIREVDAEAGCVVIRNRQNLPVAMARNCLDDESGNAGWQGIGVDKRLRQEIAAMLGMEDYELEPPLADYPRHE